MQTKLELVAAIEECLPQTQCGKCGYAGCAPYAEAIARQETTIDKCPPGGKATMQKLAVLLNQDLPTTDLTITHGHINNHNTVAAITESLCIGCTKCITACPVDAIIGASKQMHVVLTDHCTGCGLCLPPCPMDCIELVPRASMIQELMDLEDEQIQKQMAIKSKQRFLMQPMIQAKRHQLRNKQRVSTTCTSMAAMDKKSLIQQAIARAKNKLPT